MVFRLRCRRPQCDPTAEAEGVADTRALAGCKLIGRWRMVEADIWDPDDLALCVAATIVIGADGRVVIAFAAAPATHAIEHGPTSAAVEWLGYDEMDQVSGEGYAQLIDDRSFKIEFAYNNGDEAVRTACR